MEGLTGNLRMDLHRAFHSAGFLVAVIGITVALLLGCTSEAAYIGQGNYDVLTFFNLSHAFGFSQLLPIFCALPFAASFCSDWNNQYFRLACIRSNVRCYSISKVIVCSLSAASSAILGECIYVAVLALKFPLYDADIEKGFSSIPFEDLVYNGHYIVVYILLRILIWAAFFAFFSVFAFLVSTWIPNVFVVLSTPVLAYYLVTNVDSTLLYLTNSSNWYKFMSFSFLFDANLNVGTILTSLLYPLLLCILLCILSGFLVNRNLKRRLLHV